MWFARDGMPLETIAELDGGSDRTVAVVATAIVESFIQDAIKNDLCRDQSKYGLEVEANSFSPDGVLGTFGAKISLAFHLGYLTEDAHRDLLNLKYLRNKFAHYSDNYSFDIQFIKDRCANFRLINSRVKQTTTFLRATDGSVIKSESVSVNERDGVYLNLPEPAEALKTAKGRFVATAKLFCVAFNPQHHIRDQITKPTL